MSFEDCVAAGYPVAGGVIPATCTTPDGKIFTEKMPENEKENSIEKDIDQDEVAPENNENTETGRERGGCQVTGCSGQVCADNDVITTCEYYPEYACYENAVCERQADSECGWTLTTAVGRCLQELGEKNQELQPFNAQ